MARRYFEHKGYKLPRSLELFKKELEFFEDCPEFTHNARCLTGGCKAQVEYLHKFFARIYQLQGRNRQGDG